MATQLAPVPGRRPPAKTPGKDELRVFQKEQRRASVTLQKEKEAGQVGRRESLEEENAALERRIEERKASVHNSQEYKLKGKQAEVRRMMEEKRRAFNEEQARKRKEEEQRYRKWAAESGDRRKSKDRASFPPESGQGPPGRAVRLSSLEPTPSAPTRKSTTVTRRASVPARAATAMGNPSPASTGPSTASPNHSPGQDRFLGQSEDAGGGGKPGKPRGRRLSVSMQAADEEMHHLIEAERKATGQFEAKMAKFKAHEALRNKQSWQVDNLMPDEEHGLEEFMKAVVDSTARNVTHIAADALLDKPGACTRRSSSQPGSPAMKLPPLLLVEEPADTGSQPGSPALVKAAIPIFARSKSTRVTRR
mmetsp:Transcript_47768/g.119374  ORF Transcript_47768/g.119374 Transcript_47768/m.119374 type:complete len:364 (-) Transcript_47768:79-1170(-)